jgi:hypothetical protein
MNATHDVSTDNLFKEISTTIYFLVRIPQGTTKSFIGTGNTDGLAGNEVITKDVD